ncbi:MAG: hypothetical protein ACI9NT_002210, partial [Bacteroidia bacterium]
GSQFQQRCDLAVYRDIATSLVERAANSLQQGRSSGTVAAYDAHRFPCGHSKTHIL